MKRKPPFTVIFKLKKRDMSIIQAYKSYSPKKDKLIGYLAFCVHPDRIDAIDFTVEDEFKRKGYGRMLMRILQAYAYELNLRIELSSLQKALPFYKKCGFKKQPKQHDELELVWYPKRKKK